MKWYALDKLFTKLCGEESVLDKLLRTPIIAPVGYQVCPSQTLSQANVTSIVINSRIWQEKISAVYFL